MPNLSREERKQSLAAARQACELLAAYVYVPGAVMLLGEDSRAAFAALLEEFKRLDENAQRPGSGRKRIQEITGRT